MLKKTPVVLGNARFTVYSSGCVRMEYAPGGAFSPYASLLVGPKQAKAIKADVVVKGKKLTIKTVKFELVYEDNGENFTAANLKVFHKNHSGNSMVWAPGKKDQGNLGTVTRSLDQWKWCGGPGHYPMEGILSTDGAHLVQDDARVYWNAKHDWPECCAQSVWFDGYLFAYGNDFKGALQDFVNVFGPVPMVPRWAFGFWYSRWYAYTDKEIVDLVKRYRKTDVPIDVMIIDTDWRGGRGGWGGYDWNPKYFPHARAAMKKLHDMGVRTSLNDHPGYDNYDGLPANDSHIPAIQKRLGALPHQGQWACDWSNKEAVAAWSDILLGPKFDEGMDFWWIDGWLKPPFANTDSQLWANRLYFELTEKKTNKRGLVLSRWGGVGSHRYPVQFSGDTPSEWSMLQYQIEFTQRSGTLGAVYWSHDIGGFFGKQVDEELFIRWAQFGAMSPIFRTHSDHGMREPWMYSKKVQVLFRKQTRIRCALAPYFYTLAREAHETGLPIIRPLYLDYNDNDGGALGRKHQYGIGSELLVIPAEGPVDKNSGVYRKRAYFPNATWYGLETDEIRTGMLDGHVDIPIERIPVYVREGAIVPCQEVSDHVGTRVPKYIEFDYFPGRLKESTFTLYEDDGESKDHEKGRFAKTTIRGKASETQIEMQVSKPAGSYKGMPVARDYGFRIRLPRGAGVSGVKARIGNGDWKTVGFRVGKECLAGTVQSGHSFCCARVASRNEPVRICVTLMH